MAGQRTPGPLCVTTSWPIDDGTARRATSWPPRPVGAEAAFCPNQEFAQVDDGLELVLTPLKQAAIFNQETIEEGGSLKDRLWGAATAVGGALELVGAGALLLAPEPTTLTKVAGTALGAHGIDTATTGIRQVISGKPETTLTAKSAATALGVDEKNAALIGLSVDIGIPLLIGLVGAARVLAIRRGAISLAAEEAAGGHTIARHVGRSEAQLRARLAVETRIRAATTFRNLSEAEEVVAAALRANKEAITAWSKTAATNATQAITYDAGKSIGFGVVRSTNAVQEMTRVAVVIRKVETNGRLYFVLTAYPNP